MEKPDHVTLGCRGDGLYLSGSSDRSTAFAIAIDSTGSAYVTGETADMTFPTTPDAFQTTLGRTVFQFHEGTNAFVTKFTPDGSALLYSTSCCAKTRPMGYAALR